MAIMARTPVIVGVGQAEQRTADPVDALEPIDLLSVAARAAGTDAGARRSLLDALDTIAIARIVSWPYPDPGSLLGRRLGAEGVRRTLLTPDGGNSPQLLVNAVATEILDGACDVVLVGGVECLSARLRARREPKAWLSWTEDDAPPCPDVRGDPRPGNSAYEDAHFANAPVTVYPLLETALRASAGHGIEEHQRVTSELWATFAAVSAENPHAWSREAYTPEQIRTVTPENRMVTFPYPKRMCSRIEVDQAAALLLCSYETAVAAGIAEERMVFPLAGADAHDHYFFSERDRLDASPAIEAAARTALTGVGLTIDDVACFDLYSCFPAAVQITMRALGLAGPTGGDVRPLTVTGGLAFAGGPANNYAAHAIARMVEELRADPGSVGLVHALGWYTTKHSIGVYSTTPPANGFALADPTELQAGIDALPRRETAGFYSGNATVETTAVAMDREGAGSYAVATLLTPDGRRVLAATRDADTMASMTREPWEGRVVSVTTDQTVNRLAP